MSQTLKQVQDHYIDYPYPYRNPDDDKTRLLKVHGDYLGEMNHWLFRGKEDFKKEFRVLVPGGGTGDSTVYLAEQLKDTDAEVVYLDFSIKSMEIAQKRAMHRGVYDKITWINDSILNIPNLNLGTFDYMTCTGVLHHLADPDLGLKILADALNEHGGMHIMLYAQYGRTGVYQVQEMLRMINQNAGSRAEEVKNAWAVVNNLPNTNWYSRGKELLQDHIHFGDIGMYDMFLHKQDRAYTIPQIYDFVENAGLNFIDHASAQNRVLLRPEMYFHDPELFKKITALDIKTQQAICEIFYGSLIKHLFYVSKHKKTVAKLTDMDNVPYMHIVHNIPQLVCDYIKQHPESLGTKASFSWPSDLLGTVTLHLPISKYTEHFFRHMIGGEKSFAEIHHGIEQDMQKKVSMPEFLGEINRTLPEMMAVGVLLLRHKSVQIAQF